MGDDRPKIVIARGADDPCARDLADRFPEVDFVLVDWTDDPVPHVEDAQVYVPGPWDESVFEAARQLRWLHFFSAGVDRRLFPALLESDVLITNASGVYAEPMADHAMAMMYMFARGLNFCRPDIAGWRNRAARMGKCARELAGSTLGVVGYGGIGRAAGRRARALGMRVLAVARNAREPDGIAEWIRASSALHELLAESDYVLLSCPLTDETRHIIGREELAVMRDGAVLVNVGRGALVDQDALVEALRDERIAGAGLDVTTPEPLPDDSPLWTMENVVVSPHVSGASPRSKERGFELLAANLRRFLAGEPLLNPIHRDAGY